MKDKFLNKYRISSHRLQGWDYANNGHYFITLVTAGRQMLFGDIRDGKMILNEMGQIVQEEFFKSFEIRFGRQITMIISFAMNMNIGQLWIILMKIPPNGTSKMPTNNAFRCSYFRLFQVVCIVFENRNRPVRVTKKSFTTFFYSDP